MKTAETVKHRVISKRSFRLLLIANWVLAIAALVAHFVSQRSLPTELQSWLYAYHHDSQHQLSLTRSLIGLLFIVMSFVNTVGLFFFKKWAKSTLIPITILGYVVVRASYITVDLEWVVSFKSVLNILCGVTIALVFFSPLSSEFDRQSTR
ncbi:MAG: hypothetical protein ACJ741_08230 [Pyrinomonadaceae bacterium]